ncbi:hypothetical protein ONZ45_g16298 [Pleurotus djamor]|nr:hypothetical protein ONZ45_g16298 [Pleurotus djamor]
MVNSSSSSPTQRIHRKLTTLLTFDRQADFDPSTPTSVVLSFRSPVSPSSMARGNWRSHSASVQSFNVFDDDVFGTTCDNDFTDETFVATFNRVSNDGRRVYKHQLSLPAPSPRKKARQDLQEGGTFSVYNDPSLWEDVQDDETVPSGLPSSFIEDVDEASAQNYEVNTEESDNTFADGTIEDKPSEEVPKAKARRYLSSDEPLKEWLPFQSEYLEELLRGEGRATNTCDGCSSALAVTEGVLCEECFGRGVLCRKCCIETHIHQPLHRIKEWNGKCYLPSSLKTIGLRVQLGHSPNVPCPHPSSFPDFVVIHVNGLHVVHVDFCSCEKAPLNGLPRQQLLRRNWFPATTTQPQTCASLGVLKHFSMVTLQGKITMYDYHSALEKLSNNIITSDLPSRYKELTRIFREYRHLTSLKRSGRGHEDSGIAGTQNGEVGLVCPACPNPQVNLPSGWDKLPPSQRFIYTLFIALDACFRLKRRLVSSVKRDPGMGIGWSYFVEREPFRSYLLNVTDQKEMSTCSGLAALDYANTKFSRGYAATGVCLGVGERYANMDYCFASLLRHHDSRLSIVVSYDIACQWGKQALHRLHRLPSLVRPSIAEDNIRFAVPKLHIHSHTKHCQQTYSLNYLPGVGRTDGEGIERPWANIGATATSTRVMGPGAREETLNSHWSHWNWQKVTGLGSLLKRRMKNAKRERTIQQESFSIFTVKQSDRVEKWKQMVDDFELDGSKPNPYNVGSQGITVATVRLKFAQDEAKEAKSTSQPLNDVTPSTFIQEGLDIEHQQRRLLSSTQESKSATTTQELDIVDLRIKLSRRLARFRLWQAAYMPSAIPHLTARVVPDEEEVESVPLFMPSSLSQEERVLCLGNVGSVEAEFRDAECQSALNELRNGLLIKSRLLGYKNRNARHQTANTRTRTLINRNEAKIKAQTAKYQNAWEKLKLLVGVDNMTKWKKLEKDDVRCMEDPDTVTSKHARRERRVENGRPDAILVSLSGEKTSDGSGERMVPREGYRTISWIWMDAEERGQDLQVGMDKVLFIMTVLRAEWAKAYARFRRWSEEVELLREEMRRTLVSLRHEARNWEVRGGLDGGNSGRAAYAFRQAHIRNSLADQFERLWIDVDVDEDEDEDEDPEHENHNDERGGISENDLDDAC